MLELGADGTILAANGFGPDGWRSRYTPADTFSYHYTYDPQGNLVQRVRLVPGDSPLYASPDPQSYTVDPLDTSVYDAYGVRRGAYTTVAGQGSQGYQPEMAIPDPVGFGGQWGYYTDPETNLVLMTHRYYDPGTGRFLTRDPSGYNGGLNLYAFTGNNPVNRMDPEGTDWLDDIANFSAGAGDSLTLGLTKYGRKYVGEGFSVGDANQAINYNSGAYIAGEYTETVVEVGATLGSAALKKAALRQGAKELARAEFNRMTRNIARNGRNLHHLNPLAGNPVNITRGRTRMTLFPTQGLPALIHSNPLNLRLLNYQAHMAAHRRLIWQEKLLEAGFNRYTIPARAVRNTWTEWINNH